MAEIETGLKWWLRYIAVPLLAGSGIVGLISFWSHTGVETPISASSSSPVSTRRTNSSETPKARRQLQQFAAEIGSIDANWRARSGQVEPLARRMTEVLRADYPDSAAKIERSLDLLDAGALLEVLRLETQSLLAQVG